MIVRSKLFVCINNFISTIRSTENLRLPLNFYRSPHRLISPSESVLDSQDRTINSRNGRWNIERWSRAIDIAPHINGFNEMMTQFDTQQCHFKGNFYLHSTFNWPFFLSFSILFLSSLLLSFPKLLHQQKTHGSAIQVFQK